MEPGVDAFQIAEMWLRQLMTEPPLNKYPDIDLVEGPGEDAFSLNYGGEMILVVWIRPPKITVDYHGLNYPPESQDYALGDPELDEAITDYVEMFMTPDDEELSI